MNRYVWLIGVLLACVVFVPVPGPSRAVGAIHDFAHAPIFGIVCWALLAWFRAWHPPTLTTVARQYACAIAIAIVLGFATEVAQYVTGRDASWVDFGADTLGVIVFAGFFLLFDRRIATPLVLKTSVAIMGVAALVWHTAPLVTTLRAYLERNTAFPVLFDGSGTRSNLFAETSFAEIADGRLPARFARQPNERALRIDFGEGTWPGLHLYEPVSDWRAYHTLVVDVTNPEAAPLELNLRVHDRAHNHEFADRFNRSFLIPAQTRTKLRVPLAEIRKAPRNRELDLSSIDALILFTRRPDAPRTAYLSKIWLAADE